ncbi:MAG TPA: UDP-N-acetylmuramyl-tripeptide synthetase [Candidatus Paceibacterota bacterium]|nr:UDP-N-acetylmuramyl-tripeptide synthetase [Candidatus Paceibacterota bacterium]
METLFRTIKKLLPKKFFRTIQPAYHFLYAFAGAMRYRFPSREIYVLGITGTKGKSSVSEITNAICEEAGLKTAMVNGIRFKVGDRETRNRLKMTMPGRTLIQDYLRRAVEEKCDIFILEMTSEGVKQFRHKFIELDALIFTNLSPEHIESHGSYENYRAAKLKIAEALAQSRKQNRAIIVNGDDKESWRFLEAAGDIPNKIIFSLEDAKPHRVLEDGLELTFQGEKIRTPLRGTMNIYNILAAASFANFRGVSTETIKKALLKIKIPGRLEGVSAGQNFDIIVDYAHTADSLRQVYEIFEKQKKIAVLGSTGGGRDKAKRKEMGALADQFCDQIILTNEDPYDEDPQKIIEDVAQGVTNHQPMVIMDRREAIARALSLAASGNAVIITGKGTDPYIMEANGKKTPWSDAQIAKEEMEKILERKRTPSSAKLSGKI